jgi:putative ABC transport system permease protein
VIRFYQLLLYLYPKSFRTEYGAEMSAAFQRDLTETSRPAAVLHAIADVIPNSLATHFDILRQDLRYAARTLYRSPGFAITAILVVALGIGANTAAFSLADFVLLRPLPFPDSDRIVQIWSSTPGSQNETAPAKYRDWKTMATRSFSGMAAYSRAEGNLVGQGIPRRLTTARVTPDLMPFMGVPAAMGSIITPANSSQALTAVLSHDLWQSQFGGVPDVIGKTIRLDGDAHTIIGIMPPAYRFPFRETEIWTSIHFTREDYEDRGNNYLAVMARLKPGVTFESAVAEMETITAHIQKIYPEEGEDRPLVTMHFLRDRLPRTSRMLVLALSGAALCILLLACANLANLLLARGVSRARELSIRTALGAGRDRLIRQFITESITLAVAGGVIGIALAAASLPLLAKLVPASLPIQEVPEIDLRVLAFAAVLIGLIALGFGVVPLLSFGKRMRSAMVIVEIASSIVLLIMSGLLMRAIWRIQSIDPGFRAEGVLTVRTALPWQKYLITATRQRFYDRVLEGVRVLPGVKSTGYTTGLPMIRTGGIRGVEIPGAPPSPDNGASFRFITPGYFDAIGVPLLRGRGIESRDTAASPYVAVISESCAKKHWPGQDPIGRQFKIANADRTVIGIAGDVKVRGLERINEPQVYAPSTQIPDNWMGYIPQDLVIRSTLPPAQLIPAVRRIVADADAEQPVSHIQPLSEILANDTAPRRVQLRVLWILCAIALLIAGVGIYGVLSFTVSQRTKELGIRRVLGAQSGQIMRIILRDALRLTLIGAVLGVAIAMAAGRGMSALLFGVPPTDPQTIVVAVVICLLTAVIGCLRPAWRAAQVDPMVAVRES